MNATRTDPLPLPADEVTGDAEVSVVLPTFRRDALLRRCLDRLATQRDVRFEVIVVDDARSDTTPGVIAAARAVHPGLSIRLLPGRGRGPATARNIGWRAASGRVIAFMDDDAYPLDDGWLERGLRHFEDPDVLAAGGAVRVPIEGRPTDFQRNVQGLERGRFLTCNAFYSREALEAVGGFDERFTVPFREDSDLQFRVEALGGAMITDDRLVVIHPAPRGSFGVSLRLQRNSLFNALIFKKHPLRYASLDARPPLHYYAMVAFGALGIVSALTHRFAAAKAFTAVWAALETRFFLRRASGVDHTPRHLLDLAITSLLIPPLSVYWRLRGAVRYRVWFF